MEIMTDLHLCGLGMYAVESVVTLAKLMNEPEDRALDDEEIVSSLHYLADCAVDRLARNARPAYQKVVVALQSLQDAALARGD